MTEILRVLAGFSIVIFVVLPITVAIGALLVHLFRRNKTRK